MAAPIQRLQAADPDWMHSTNKFDQSSNQEPLQKLINAYYVRNHKGRTYDEVGGNRVEFILEWLQPVKDVSFIDNPKTAIEQGARFNLGEGSWKLTEQIFNYELPVGDVIKDFALWPMRNVWGYSGWDLLQGYVNTADRKTYFEQITGEPAGNFLNHTERIFYLTRGYGRPNIYISPQDLKARHFYMKAAPTALIALNDLLGICSTRQDPQFVLEKLSDVDLVRIDKFHQKAVEEITLCLNKKQLCTGLACNPQMIDCFNEFLMGIGALTIFTYDPSDNIFISNISQLGLYQHVVPDKKWHLNDITDMPDIYIRSILAQLPDNEVVSIEVPHAGPFNPDLTTLKARLRESLLQKALAFITRPRYFFLENGLIGYGRPIDSQLDEMSSADLIQSVQQHDALIDPYGHAISVELAKELFPAELDNVINKTQSMQVNNYNLIQSIPFEERKELIEKLQRDDVDLKEVLTEQAEELMLWSKQNTEWIPIAMDFKTYFELWAPSYPQIIKDTLEYYTETLA